MRCEDSLLRVVDRHSPCPVSPGVVAVRTPPLLQVFSSSFVPNLISRGSSSRVRLDLRLSRLWRTTSPLRIISALRLLASQVSQVPAKAPNFLQLGYVCTCTAQSVRAAAPPAQHRFGLQRRPSGARAVHFRLQRCCAHRRVVQRDWMAYISENSVISCSLHLHICYFAPYARH